MFVTSLCSTDEYFAIATIYAIYTSFASVVFKCQGRHIIKCVFSAL